ncbi:MAG: sel1 repeat family protein, partial [Candidatus Cloacimonetes bacterium]|nr:sel1 repeat family protein [Candidatus Cloacimonadota bacterium]
VNKDIKKASVYFIKSAENGSVESMCQLGKMSLSGEGMVKSRINAIKWLKKASARGSEEAKEILAAIR